MFRKGGVFRHRNCLDIDIRVLDVCHVSEKRYKMKVDYMMQRSGLPMGFRPERVCVKREDLKNWSLVINGVPVTAYGN